MYAATRATQDEVRTTFPKLQRLLIASFAVSASSALAHIALSQASDDSHPWGTALRRPEHGSDEASHQLVPEDDDGSGLGVNAGDSLRSRINGTGLDLSGPASNQHVWRRGDLYVADLFLLISALVGLRMPAGHDGRKRLLALTVFTFAKFTRSVLLLLKRVDVPPGARHLLSLHCPVPLTEIARVVRQRLRDVRLQMEAGLPCSEGLLMDWEAWPLVLDENATVDLCSPSWALSNAYLIASGVLALWLHAYAFRMFRGANALHDTLAFSEGAGASSRVVVFHQGNAPGEQTRPFVPFTGFRSKLNL